MSKRNFRPSVIIVLAGALFFSSALAAPNQATKIEVQLFLIDFIAVNEAKQNFTASVFFRFRWHDPTLVGRYETKTTKPLNSVWNPGLLVVNQLSERSGLPDVVSIDPDGTVTYTKQIWGQFAQPLDLQDFPLDAHTFKINMVATHWRERGIEFTRLQDFPSGIADKLSVPNWSVDSWKAEPVSYRPVAKGPAVPGYQFQISASRHQGYYLVKFVIPLMFIVAMSWIVFWIDPTLPGPQISVAATSMLTLIAYQFLVGNLLPPISYMTRLDIFMLVSTVMVFAALCQAVLTAKLADTERVALARRIDVGCRVTFPIILAGLWLYSFT